MVVIVMVVVVDGVSELRRRSQSCKGQSQKVPGFIRDSENLQYRVMTGFQSGRERGVGGKEKEKGGRSGKEKKESGEGEE